MDKESTSLFTSVKVSLAIEDSSDANDQSAEHYFIVGPSPQTDIPSHNST
jgi:hypothetical protein